AGVEQLLDDDLDAALLVDINHRVVAERTHVHEHRHAPRQVVEFVLAENVVPEVDSRGARDLDAVKRDVRRPTHRDGNGEGSATRVRAAASGSPANWKAATTSMRSPVAGSIPGWIEPSDTSTAGALCSRTAASVPTGGLSQATTAITPAMVLACKCRSMASLA